VSNPPRSQTDFTVQHKNLVTYRAIAISQCQHRSKENILRIESGSSDALSTEAEYLKQLRGNAMKLQKQEYLSIDTLILAVAGIWFVSVFLTLIV
jgi:hypothetical protein